VRAVKGVSVRKRGSALTVRTPTTSYLGIRPLAGAHQRINLMVAIRALEELKATRVPIDLGRAVAAMSEAKWPGRLERFEGTPPFLLDGAHNPAGARALASFLAETHAPHVLVFGAMRDKHVEEMAQELFRKARLVIATRVHMRRAAPTARLKEIGRALGTTLVEEPSVRLAFERAKKTARAGETVVVAGSLYLVGAFRRLLLAARR